MTIVEMLIAKRLTDEELKAGIAKVFDISVEDIFISHNFPFDVDRNIPWAMICFTYTLFKGDFPTWIEIIPMRDDFVSKVNHDHMNFSFLMLEYLNCEALITDGSSYNPCAFVLLNPQKSMMKVVVDRNQLDQEEPAYVIERYVT